MLNNEFKCSFVLSGNFRFTFTIDSDKFFKGSVTVFDVSMGQTVINAGSVDVRDILNLYYWVASNEYNNFNSYGAPYLAPVEFAKYCDNNCDSIVLLPTVCEYFNNCYYGGFDIDVYDSEVLNYEVQKTINEVFGEF